MGKWRVLIGEFKHETNTFITKKTGMKDYKERYIKIAEEIIPFFKGTKSEIGAFIDVGKEENLDLIPSIAANAWPGGAVERDVFEMVRNSIINTISKSEPIDAILLSLHGAMVTEDIQDGEGELLAAIRMIVGDEIPIITTLDLHANVTVKMIDNVNGFFPFDHYPHTDIYEKGLEAAKALVKILSKHVKPTIRFRKLPMLCPLLETDKEPYKQFLDMVYDFEKDPKVISASIISGFPYADIYDGGMSIIAQTDNDDYLALKIVNEIGDLILHKHNEFVIEAISIEEAITRGINAREGPIVLGDFADNVGAGAPGDGTHILRKLLEMNVKNVGVALIADPQTVEEAINGGVGSIISIELGGKINAIAGTPVFATAIVKTIADGKYVYKGPLFRGQQTEIGKTVVLDLDGIEVVVCERRAQPLDLEVFRRFGIEPLNKKIIVIKSSVHYRAAYGPIAKEIITVDSPGIVAPNLKQFLFHNIKRPIYPLDEQV